MVPDLATTNPELFQNYAEVVKTGRHVVFDTRTPRAGRTMRISATRPARGDFLAVLEDVTEHLAEEEALAASNERMEKMVYDVAAAMGSVVEARDAYTQGHQVRVAKLSCSIAREMGRSEEEIDEVNMAGLLHDIGKLRVPAEILSKPGTLSDLEMKLIREHPDQAFEILRQIDFPWRVAEVVREHHERLDGSGYPRGLRGDEIILPARILAVADVVEAMASHRPYRPAVGLDKAIEEVVGLPERYDATVAAACKRLYDRGEIEGQEERAVRST
jgi:putative nucleotidyltransferase with HDIG domain